MRARLRRVSVPALAVTCLLFGGCAGTSADLMIGTKLGDGGFTGPSPIVTLRLRQRLTERTWCEYEHVSHLTAGAPFGPRAEEDRLNQVGCGISFGASDLLSAPPPYDFGRQP
jgi:hypothetical protein